MAFKRRAKRGRRPTRRTNMKALIKRTIYQTSETKWKPTEAVEQAIATSTAVTIFTDISDPTHSDASATGRIGQRLKGIGLLLNYFVKSTVTAEAQYFRVIVIGAPDELYDGVADKFLQDASGLTDEVFVADDLLDIMRPLAKQKFNILYDKSHKLNGTDAGHGNSNVWKKKLIKFNHVRTATGSGDEYNKNNLRLLVVNRNINNDAGATTAEFTFFTKYYYKDV